MQAHMHTHHTHARTHTHHTHIHLGTSNDGVCRSGDTDFGWLKIGMVTSSRSIKLFALCN